MSVLIKGMEMPKNCYVCPFCDYVSARCDAVKGTPYTPESRYEKRSDFCPLVPVPPHGDLIDRDALCDGRVSNDNVIICAKAAPVIIEAEPFNNLSKTCNEAEEGERADFWGEEYAEAKGLAEECE